MPHTPLPDRRATVRQKARFGGQTFYLEVGEYPDGSPGEIFVVAAKEGTLVRGLLDAFARVVSRALQYGVPPADIVEMVEDLDFAPQGPVHGSDAVKECRSVVDWVARELAAWHTPRPAPASVTGASTGPDLSPDEVFALGVADGSVSASLGAVEKVAGFVSAGPAW